MKKVGIVGGGISGLVTAYYLKKFSKERNREIEVTVYEKEEVPGGKMRTAREGGFIVEWGPNGFLTNKPDTLDLCGDMEITERLYPSSDDARIRCVYSGGKLHRLPESPGAFFRSPLLSPGGRLRVAIEPFIPRRKNSEDESLFHFAKRRLGEEAAEKLIEPMAAGIYAGNPDEMSLKSCFPLIHDLESHYGSLVRGMIGKMRERRGKRKKEGAGPAGPGGVLTSFNGGVTSLVEEISGRGDFSIHLQSEVRFLTRGEGSGGFELSVRIRGEQIRERVDAVVISSPAYAASPILEGLAPSLSKTLADIPYAPVAVVALGFRKKGFEDMLKSFGFLIPRKEGRKALGILFDSSIFVNRAPDGYALLRGMIGGARSPHLAHLSPGKLADIMREEVETILGVRESIFVKVFTHERGIPQYLTGHSAKLEIIEKELKRFPGIYLNSNAYRGIGLNDCVKNSRETAMEVVEQIFPL